MYIIVGNTKQYNDLKDKIVEEFGEKVSERVKELAEMLDGYGPDRDIFKEDGGWVSLIKDEQDLASYNEEYNDLLSSNAYEYCNHCDFDPFIEVLYLVNNETGINFFIPRELFIYESEL